MKLTLKNRILLMMALLGLLPLLLLFQVGLKQTESILLSNAHVQLRTLRENLSRQIESSFHSVSQQVVLLSASEMLSQALQEFSQGCKQLSASSPSQELLAHVHDFYLMEILPKLRDLGFREDRMVNLIPLAEPALTLQQTHLIRRRDQIGVSESYSDGALYDQAFVRYHQRLRQIQNRLGYFDLLLIDLEGIVVYSSSKRLYLGTNVHTGSEPGQSLKQCYSKALANDFHYLDYSAFAPAFGESISLICKRVQPEGKPIGVLAALLTNQGINRIMNSIDEDSNPDPHDAIDSYIVGSDYWMKSESRFARADALRLARLLRPSATAEDLPRRVRLPRVLTESVRFALEGKSGTIQQTGYHGREVISAYSGLQFGSEYWAIVVERDVSSILRPLADFRTHTRWILIPLAILILLAASGLANVILIPINRLADLVNQALGSVPTSTSEPVVPGWEIAELHLGILALLSARKESIARSEETQKLITAQRDYSIAQLERAQSVINRLPIGVLRFKSNLEPAGENLYASTYLTRTRIPILTSILQQWCKELIAAPRLRLKRQVQVNDCNEKPVWLEIEAETLSSENGSSLQLVFFIEDTTAKTLHQKQERVKSRNVAILDLLRGLVETGERPEQVLSIYQPIAIPQEICEIETVLQAVLQILPLTTRHQLRVDGESFRSRCKRELLEKHLNDLLHFIISLPGSSSEVSAELRRARYAENQSSELAPGEYISISLKRVVSLELSSELERVLEPYFRMPGQEQLSTKLTQAFVFFQSMGGDLKVLTDSDGSITCYGLLPTISPNSSPELASGIPLDSRIQDGEGLPAVLFSSDQKLLALLLPMLLQEGVECIAASSLAEALSEIDALQSNGLAPRAIFTDMDSSLHIEDGLRLAQHCQHRFPKAPLVLLSSQESEAELKQYRHSGFVAALQKPVILSRLQQILRELS